MEEVYTGAKTLQFNLYTCNLIFQIFIKELTTLGRVQRLNGSLRVHSLCT